MSSWLGIGVDMVRVERVAKISQAARERLFTPAEIITCESAPARSAERFAARFAAKEAVLKALGTGLSQGMRWHDVEVAMDPLGAPQILLHGEAKKLADVKRISKVLISLSHDGGFAIAMAALQSKSD